MGKRLSRTGRPLDDRKRDWVRVMRANGARQVEGPDDPRAGPNDVIAFEQFGWFRIYGPMKNGKRKPLANF